MQDGGWEKRGESRGRWEGLEGIGGRLGSRQKAPLEQAARPLLHEGEEQQHASACLVGGVIGDGETQGRCDLHRGGLSGRGGSRQAILVM